MNETLKRALWMKSIGERPSCSQSDDKIALRARQLIDLGHNLPGAAALCGVTRDRLKQLLADQSAQPVH